MERLKYGYFRFFMYHKNKGRQQFGGGGRLKGRDVDLTPHLQIMSRLTLRRIWGLNLKQCPRRRGFTFTVFLNTLPSLRCPEACSMRRIEGL
jgi:hypothetical protein